MSKLTEERIEFLKTNGITIDKVSKEDSEFTVENMLELLPKSFLYRSKVYSEKSLSQFKNRFDNDEWAVVYNSTRFATGSTPIDALFEALKWFLEHEYTTIPMSVKEIRDLLRGELYDYDQLDEDDDGTLKSTINDSIATLEELLKVSDNDLFYEIVRKSAVDKSLNYERLLRIIKNDIR